MVWSADLSFRIKMTAMALHRRSTRRIAACAVAAASLIVFLLRFSHDYVPRLTGIVTLQLTVPAGTATQSEPIIVTGVHDKGDLLTIRYVDEATAEFCYDHWGSGGPCSERVRFQPGRRHVFEIELPSLAASPTTRSSGRGQLRLVFDGREILATQVAFHDPLPRQIFFGENAIGGS